MAHKADGAASSSVDGGSSSTVHAPFDLSKCYHVGPYSVDPSWSFGAPR